MNCNLLTMREYMKRFEASPRCYETNVSGDGYASRQRDLPQDSYSKFDDSIIAICSEINVDLSYKKAIETSRTLE